MWKKFFMQIATLSLIPLLVVGVIVKSAETRSENKANKKDEVKRQKTE